MRKDKLLFEFLQQIFVSDFLDFFLHTIKLHQDHQNHKFFFIWYSNVISASLTHILFVTAFKLVTVECSLWARNINENSKKALNFRIYLNDS